MHALIRGMIPLNSGNLPFLPINSGHVKNWILQYALEYKETQMTSLEVTKMLNTAIDRIFNGKMESIQVSAYIKVCFTFSKLKPCYSYENTWIY
jgi:hypothetical protein